LWSAVPVVFVALAQMFIVGGSEIDLGVGAFAGLINVISATLYQDSLFMTYAPTRASRWT
jgi:ribose transport system ATP-binding protein